MTFTVTITNGGTPEVYAGLPATKLYVAAMFGDGADAFNALDDNTMSRILRAVTLYFDAHAWQGAADGFGGTTLQLPRSGIVDANGATISDATQLALIASAAGEMCALAAADPSVLSASDNSANLRTAKAGSAEVEFFNPTSLQQATATVLPTPVMRLIGAWLDTSATSAAHAGSGQSGQCETSFGCDQVLDRRWPF